MTTVELTSRPHGVPPGTAAADFLMVDLAGLAAVAASATSADVDRSLLAGRRSLPDLAVLLSPVAGERLEDLAAAASRATVQRFGRVVRLFAPLYLSNECVSVCTYCGFSAGNEIARRTLSVDEVVAEGRELVARGFRHVLLVAGEHARIVSKDYLVACVEALAPVVPSLSVEVQVWDTATYRRLVAAGCEGLVVYQEAYDRDVYESCHLKGKKRNYDWRLAAPDRGAEAGMRSLGIGALLGLDADWRREVLAVGAHASALLRRWWRCEVSVSLPRLRPAAGGFEPARPLSDAEFVQVVCALRLCLPTVGISLSTRESPALRDGVFRLGVTSMSAGSHTEPGGYAEPSDADRQFEIADARSPSEVASMLRAAGYEPVWKDTIGPRHVP
ncbi:MAG: 2-iminoacetate synthase [Actinomycetota bacterium]|jgi:2-iminoacetate synthase|nr:2-iminoacetate synthase [Actinomycetota bacterium]